MSAVVCYLPYTLSYGIAALTVCGASLGGLGSLLGVFLVFVIHPLFDNVFFKNLRLPRRYPPSMAANSILLLAFPFLCGFLFYGFSLVSHVSEWELVGLILSFGTVMGLMGINTSHELVHRQNKFFRAVGVSILFLVNFPHWGIEHVFGHHKNVATPEDGATARKNEPIYSYHWRSYFCGLRHALQIENQRVSKKRNFWGHRIFWYLILQLVLAVTVHFIGGARGLVFWFGQSAVAILLLQTVDYVEHYGLLRQKKADGTYEGYKPWQSWDSYQALTNFALIKLAFHSHHHLKPLTPFENLQEEPKAMHLPLGYSVMALLTYLPPLYFKIMNPRLQDNREI